MSDFILELFGTNILSPFHSKSKLIDDILIFWNWKRSFNATITFACFVNRRRLFSYTFSLKHFENIFFRKKNISECERPENFKSEPNVMKEVSKTL